MKGDDNRQTVAVAGLGAIGRVLAARLDAGLPGLKLSAVAARDIGKAKPFLDSLSASVPVLPLRD
ncbi:MAG TPA: aspartate dehydrogenase, partial [Stellaceae bacterium]|nr:aspartate dehydrogenase [Stellaceae bacterium]